MIIIKRAISVILLLLTAILFTVESRLGDDFRFKNEPSYETANRWYNTDGIITEIQDLKTDKAVTYRQKAGVRYKEGTYLIIRKSHLKVTAFTKNKVIYSNSLDNKKEFAFIPVDEVIEGEDVSLLFEPTGKKEGKITDTLRLQSKNDFYFFLLNREIKTVKELIFIAVLFLFCLFKRKTLPALILFSLFLFILSSSSLSGFVFGIYALQVSIKALSAVSTLWFGGNYIIAIKKQIW